jgi:hypothetical protein
MAGLVWDREVALGQPVPGQKRGWHGTEAMAPEG